MDKNKKNSEVWKGLIKKVDDGTAEAKDLF